ncbi:histidine phosphatase family protein [Colwellia sp. 6_MG-2023]|uniref:histidine phosphatase family protein n=1 Tax=Colwellia sp. 6_MG-2023 TaxID=3062676 RepID=UPI0026E43708|nr:histidine phosphatase family protein [Colwellia sp. 6_MG-2023]MDO6488383.1 histidine phosphatase family protein [Colwellia sp. 6_MG-2023]
MEIILIRHGKPTSANNPMVNAAEYAKWIRRYNFSDVADNSRPKSINTNYISQYTISSDLKRAIHSTNIYVGKKPDEINRLYREMDIPRYKLPFSLTAWQWVYFCRVLWMFGFTGSFETFKQAKQRANIAASELIKAANKQNTVVLFGHGFMNRYIRKSLIQAGWTLTSKSNDYWGVTRLKI